MDFKDTIKQLADRIEKLKDNIQTEEATKNAFIMPFINALGGQNVRREGLYPADRVGQRV